MSNRVPFNENTVSPKRDPLAGDLHQDFDWEGLYASLGEQENVCTIGKYERVGSAIQDVIRYILAVDFSQPNAERIIARRFCRIARACGVALPRKLEGRL